MDTQMKRTWAEINLTRLEHNYLALRELTGNGCRFMGLLKANAYGHGALPVARRLEELGADYFGVAFLDEAQELRRGGIKTPVLILGNTPVEFAGELLDGNITQTIFDEETARALSEAAVSAGKRLRVHIKVDTGMTRLGFLCDEAHMDASVERIAAVCALPGLEAEGIFTHFADAGCNEEYTMKQFTRFLAVLDKLKEKGVSFPIRHCAASAATLKYPCTHLDMVRPGIALYGHYPDPGMEELCPLLPVMEVRTRIADVRSVPKGTAVSYGCTHILDRDSRLAVLPVGYGDGFFRLLSDRQEVLIGGRRARVTGRVCMDLFMVDVTDLPDVTPGEVATLFGEDGGALLPLEEAAGRVGTISYELLCDVNARVPRLYIPA
ncbi:Alanine racemase 1 [bioreactor metagenome]|uniref:Alanine racemase 1 n=1 Tax=bioreactor metagenome TaxID=1076179 RepID=A0A644Z5M2_9ZZZZ